jgi:thiopurine S-methyltransferase
VHHDFWHERWRTGQIGFHQQAVHPLLERWWPGLGVSPGARVYVPLCGKSLDMAWLAGRGHTVLGSELSRIAIDEFFAGESLQPTPETRDGFTHHAAGPYEILEGDALALTTPIAGPLDAVYDRAALVALPPEMRGPYVESLARLLPCGARGLVVSFEYPQEMKGGPPFSVESQEILRHCAGLFTVRELERVDILAGNPKFAEFGIPALHEIAYALERT